MSVRTFTVATSWRVAFDHKPGEYPHDDELERLLHENVHEQLRDAGGVIEIDSFEEIDSSDTRTLDCAGLTVDLARGTDGAWGGHVSGPVSMALDENAEPDEATAQDMLQSLVLAHACAGIDVSSPAYQEGVRTAIEAWGNQ